MWGNLSIEIEHGQDGEACSEQVGFVESTDFCNVSPCQHSDSDAHVPRSQIGGGGGTALVVGGEVDKQGVVSREHDSETYSQQQGYSKESDITQHHVPVDKIHTCRKQEEAKYNEVKSGRNDLGDLSFVHEFTGKYTRNGHAYCHESEEETGGWH